MAFVFRSRICLSLGLLLAVVSTAAGQAATQPAPGDSFRAIVLQKGPLLLHLPGIGGYRGIDHRMLAGLRDAGVQGNFVVYDWTQQHPGIIALQSYQRNHQEAQRVADLITEHLEIDPTSPIYLTAHSGGCGIAVWALERLPPNVKVQTVLLMAPALSPKYDLSAALRHVNGKMYVFTSTLDSAILNFGTRIFGTIDGVQTIAAGFGGFVQPAGADPLMYKKLVQRPYQKDWIRYGDYGEHIGAMSRPFAAAILAPLIGPLPIALPTTEPSDSQAAKY
jgi:pimeloyl-ACP methyl ester carboxylesterase